MEWKSIKSIPIESLMYLYMMFIRREQHYYYIQSKNLTISLEGGKIDILCDN